MLQKCSLENKLFNEKPCNIYDCSVMQGFGPMLLGYTRHRDTTSKRILFSTELIQTQICKLTEPQKTRWKSWEAWTLEQNTLRQIVSMIICRQIITMLSSQNNLAYCAWRKSFVLKSLVKKLWKFSQCQQNKLSRNKNQWTSEKKKKQFNIHPHIYKIWKKIQQFVLNVVSNCPALTLSSNCLYISTRARALHPDRWMKASCWVNLHFSVLIYASAGLLVHVIA